MKNYCVNAFTILEVLVALTLTAILFGLSFYALQLFQGQFYLFAKQQTELFDCNEALCLIREDVNRERWLECQDGHLLLSSDSTSIQYVFAQGLIIRMKEKSGRVALDSFPVDVQFKEAQLDNALINEGLADYCFLQLECLADNNMDMVLRKWYSAEDRIDYGN